MRLALKANDVPFKLMPKCDAQSRKITWRGPNRLPVALVLHHTAGAATESTNPRAPGNQTGANAGQIAYVQNHFEVPAANFTLDRDGTLYCHSFFPVWHAGLGSFKGTLWSPLKVPDDAGNDYMMGVEIVSKGNKPDFTEKQFWTLRRLLMSMNTACQWGDRVGDMRIIRRPQHKDWAPNRKVDTRYTNPQIGERLAAVA